MLWIPDSTRADQFAALLDKLCSRSREEASTSYDSKHRVKDQSPGFASRKKQNPRPAQVFLGIQTRISDTFLLWHSAVLATSSLPPARRKIFAHDATGSSLPSLRVCREVHLSRLQTCKPR